MNLADREKWEAVIRGDATYDGVFFYGVKTTGVFCRPSCRSKAPLKKNIEFLENVEEATAKGYRPCKRCRPESTSPDQNDLLVERIKSIFDCYYDDRIRLSSELERMDVRQNRLIRLFHQRYHTTPTKYLNDLRAEKAARLLISSDNSMLMIAADCGFGSVPSFYATFRSHFGLTPSKFRSMESKKAVS
jgi:AraC family transcriptional regulator of adaptative response / methylphosphotriester-DNA alkyltransferase methyltransferase